MFAPVPFFCGGVHSAFPSTLVSHRSPSIQSVHLVPSLTGSVLRWSRNLHHPEFGCKECPLSVPELLGSTVLETQLGLISNTPLSTIWRFWASAESLTKRAHWYFQTAHDDVVVAPAVIWYSDPDSTASNEICEADVVPVPLPNCEVQNFIA